jgi:hypothetical protein
VDYNALCKALDARWLSNEHASSVLNSMLPAVVKTLIDGDEAAGKFHKTLTSFKFVACLALWCRVLAHFVRLSKVFQTSALDFSAIEEQVGNISAILDTEITLAADEKDRAAATPCTDPVVLAAQEQLKRLKEKKLDVTDNAKERSEFATIRSQWLAALRDQLTRRFPAVEAFTHLSSLFDPRKLPANVKTAVQQDYGKSALKAAAACFAKPVPPQRSLDQLLATANPPKKRKEKDDKDAKQDPEEAPDEDRTPTALIMF